MQRRRRASCCRPACRTRSRPFRIRRCRRAAPAFAAPAVAGGGRVRRQRIDRTEKSPHAHDPSRSARGRNREPRRRPPRPASAAAATSPPASTTVRTTTIRPQRHPANRAERSECAALADTELVPRSARRTMRTASAPAARPLATTSGDSAYAVQVTSQRSEAEAQSSFQALAGEISECAGQPSGDDPPGRSRRQGNLLSRAGAVRQPGRSERILRQPESRGRPMRRPEELIAHSLACGLSNGLIGADDGARVHHGTFRP